MQSEVQRKAVDSIIHLGDITAIDGRTAPPVDVVIGGSPCQDLSIAGRRAGLAGERSGLFMEQIRIIKEMRQADAERGNKSRFIRPRYMVWENVVGALSSNKSADFRAVLEETAKIADENAAVPEPSKKKWPTSGCIMGNGWSIAYRVFDAQFLGVPQRRRRIALVADFGGGSAPEILFVRKSVCGDIEPGQPEGQAPAPGAGGGADNSSTGITCAGFKPHAGASAGTIGYQPELVPTLDTGKPHGVLTYDARGNGDGKVICTLTGGHEGHISDYTALVMATGQANAEIAVDSCPTLNCNHEQPIVAAVNFRSGRETIEVNGTIQVDHGFNSNNVIRLKNAVRRLTPLECERLQGFPDGWTDIGPWVDSKGKLHKESSDTARYTALGNSIALPPWTWVLKRLCACYERPATMASLFDGIGGFPLIWERLNGSGTCLWASEIEEFPMAITKARFVEVGADGL